MARQFADNIDQRNYKLLLSAVRSTYRLREPHLDDSDNTAEEQLGILCNLFSVDVEDVIRVFLRACINDGTPQSKSDEALFRKMSHPTFLDLPADFDKFYGAYALTASKLVDIYQDLAQNNFAAHRIMYVFNAMNEADKRMVLHGLNLADARYRDNNELLQEITRRITDANLFRPDMVNGVNLVPAPFEPERMFEGMDASTYSRGALAAILRLNALDRRELRAVQELRQEHIDFAYQTAFYLCALMVAHKLEGRVTPIQVFDNYTPTGFIKDPLLQTWAMKITEDDTEDKPDSLLNYWDNAVPADAKPKNDRVIRAVLSKIDGVDAQTKLLKLRAFTVPQLAEAIGHSEEDVRAFLFTDRPERNAWQAIDGKWVARNGGVFESLWVFLGYDKPEAFLPVPEYAPPVKAVVAAAVETTQRPTLPPPDPFADAKAIFGDDFKPDELIKKALALVSSAKGQGRIAADLQDALKNPSRYLRSDGLPSLPHMLLMRAHKGDTQSDMSIDAVSAALQKTFDPNGEAYKAQPRTGYRAFVWTLLNDALAKGKPIASYADMLVAHDFKQANGANINPDREGADAMANRALGEINNLFDRAAAGEDLSGKRDGQLITKMVAVAGEIMNEENPESIAFVAFLGPVNRPAQRAATNVRAAFLKLTRS